MLFNYIPLKAYLSNNCTFFIMFKSFLVPEYFDTFKFHDFQRNQLTQINESIAQVTFQLFGDILL